MPPHTRENRVEAPYILRNNASPEPRLIDNRQMRKKNVFHLSAILRMHNGITLERNIDERRIPETGPEEPLAFAVISGDIVENYVMHPIRRHSMRLVEIWVRTRLAGIYVERAAVDHKAIAPRPCVRCNAAHRVTAND